MLLALIEDCIRSDASGEFMQDGRGLLLRSDASGEFMQTVADSFLHKRRELEVLNNPLTELKRAKITVII
jgi:hypothetical protein